MADTPKAPGPGRNRLAGEKSPYLLQHADNPVDWYPWGEEAFERARREDRPIFLSIGYSTCHWCHVMEHESFEDPEVAALMNRTFVCIKVDREERPDVDHIYMTACQMMTGSGGWPLTILMTPDRRPFFAATYLPKSTMLSFVPRVEAAWRENRDGLVADAARMAGALAQAMTHARGEEIGAEVLERAYRDLSARYDTTYGGFGGRPKFPTPHNLLFLLRRWKRTGDASALAMVEKTLERMRRGGIYDQVGFGFHRYSTDAQWLVPHFEKMLYDQALLLIAFVETYQATGGELYRRTAEEIASYVMRDLSAPEGGFYSAEDADSEGKEGMFYLWSRVELASVLGGDAELAASYFGVEPHGNFLDEATRQRPGTNILFVARPHEEAARALGLDAGELRDRVESIRRRLLAARERRVRPHLDDKILTDWNGLMIAALARSGRVLGRADHVERARRAADFIEGKLADRDGRLRHRHRDGEAAIAGMLDDYAFLVWGLTELYDATFDERILERSLAHARRMIELFQDAENGGFFMTARDAEPLVVRPREVYDGATPSGNSVAAWNLARLARMTGDMSLDEAARGVVRGFSNQVSSAAMVHTHLLCAVDFLLGPTVEVVIAGRRDAEDVRGMRRALDGLYLTHAVTVFRPDDDPSVVAALAPYTRDQVSQSGRATAYVCRDFACQRPTTRVDEMLRMVASPDKLRE
jgi:uncharacterized protein YyaL (SSP411 family)